MIPGMSIKSYRKYTIALDIIAVMLFSALIVFGGLMFFADIPHSPQSKQGWFFTLACSGFGVYLVSLIYQISRYKKDRQAFYLPVSTSENSE